MAESSEKLRMLPRAWASRDKPASGLDVFRVVTYNILSDDGPLEYCHPDRRALRVRHKHIMVEIETMKPDIVCYQEVLQHHWHNHLLPDMRSLGFDGVHFQRRDDDGLALCFRTGVFSLQHHTCEVYHEVLGGIIDKGGDIDPLWQEVVSLQKRHETDDRLLTRQLSLPERHVLPQMYHLEWKTKESGLSDEKKKALKKSIDRPQGALLVRLKHVKTGKDLVMAVVHLISDNLSLPELTTIQVMCTTKALKTFLGDEDNPAFIICGDFNTPPYYPGYSLLADGQMDERTIFRLKQLSSSCNEPGKHKVGQFLFDCFPSLFAHYLDLSSAYKTIMGEEPVITSADDILRLCVDYMWFSERTLEVQRVLQLPPCEAILKHVGLPSLLFPSDHLPLQAEFKFK